MRTRAILAAALLLALAAGAAAAEPGEAPRKTAGDSLLFSSEALASIEAARRAADGRAEALDLPLLAGTRPAVAPAAIHLSALVYHAPGDWRVWLNGQSFTPQAAPGEIEILAVTAGSVRLAWHGDPARPARRVELRPNQSYLVASDRVVEGKVRLGRQTARTDQGAQP